MTSPRSIAAAALILMGAAVLLLGARTTGGRGLNLVGSPSATVTAASAAEPSAPSPASPAPATRTSTDRRRPEPPTGIRPTRIRIPAIGVDASMTDLGMLGPAEMQVPSDFSEAGWLTLSRKPGEIGPAIVAGHVDSHRGPAVFFRLRELARGDEIILEAADGRTRAFVVEDRGQYPKTALPDEVFGFGHDRPELRLITCGGDFDRSVRHYDDNIVVYAALDEQAGP